MAKKNRAAKLSISEMRLIAVLWRMGPLKLSEAYDAQPGSVGYTTIQTQLNRLVEKGVVAKSESRPTRYRAIAEPKVASASTLKMLIDTVGCGSIIPVVDLLIRQTTLSKDDVKRLKQIIDDAAKNPTAKPAKKVVKKNLATSK